MNPDQMIATPLFAIVLVFLVVLAFLWLVLPFAVFGIKGRIDQQREQMKRLIALLEQNNSLLRDAIHLADLPVRNKPPGPKS